MPSCSAAPTRRTRPDACSRTSTSRARSTSSRPAPSCTACTATAGGRRRTDPCSTPASTSRASSTQRTPKRPCSASRALRTSRPRSRRSTPIRSARGWSATTSRRTFAARSASACARCSCAQGSSARTPSRTRACARKASSRRSSSCRTGSRSTVHEGRRRPDRDRAHPSRARALSIFSRALLHRRGARVLRVAEEPGAVVRGAVRGKGSRRQGARLRGRARVRVEGDRDRRPSEAVGDADGTHEGLGRARRRRRDRPLDDALPRAGERGRRGRRRMMLEPLYTADEMKAAEAGHDVDAMMQRAGAAVAEEAMRRFPDARRIALYAGEGANGGDGKIAAELLRAQGREIVDEEPDLVLDALLGTGLRGAPRNDAAATIEKINAAGAPVLAVDIPSGVNASTGEVAGAAVRAAVTVTMHGRKVGLAVAPGLFHCGNVVVADIGLEPRDTEHRLVTPEILRRVPGKHSGDNQYSAGSVLVIGGARGMTGAATLAARAAFRADAGYVMIAAPEESLPVLETLGVEAVKRRLEDVFDAAERATALALGPGLGRDHDRKELVWKLLRESDLPAVVDADALHELEPFARKAPTVLTPHSGELGRLIGEESKWVDAHRLEAMRRTVERFGCVVLLKGADTLIGAPGKGGWVVGDNAPQLATAGTGDVLTGIVAAFLAKGMDAREAAAAAAVAHRRAARLGPKTGLVAGDVVDALPAALA